MILALLDLRPLRDWVVGADMETLTMAAYAKTLEREYQCSLAPEDLKLFMKGAQYAILPDQFNDKIREDLVVGDSKYVKLCDIDVWVRGHRFSLLSSWNKITSKMASKKLGVNEKKLAEFAVGKLNGVLSERSKHSMTNALKMCEKEILKRRMEFSAIDIGYKR